MPLHLKETRASSSLGKEEVIKISFFTPYIFKNELSPHCTRIFALPKLPFFSPTTPRSCLSFQSRTSSFADFTVLTPHQPPSAYRRSMNLSRVLTNMESTVSTKADCSEYRTHKKSSWSRPLDPPPHAPPPLRPRWAAQLARASPPPLRSLPLEASTSRE